MHGSTREHHDLWFVTYNGVGGAVALRWVIALNHLRWELWEVSTSRTLSEHKEHKRSVNIVCAFL